MLYGVSAVEFTLVRMMELLQAGGQLIGVLVGALLTGATAVLRARAEQRRLIAGALSDLLEVRHQIAGVELILAEARKQLQVPAEALPIIRGLFNFIWPIEPELHKRYETAVSLLGSVNPVLAFYLRSKTAVPHMLGSFRALATQGGINPAEIEALEQTLSSMVIPVLNEAALTLGRHHSVLTWWRVRRLIKNSSTLPPEVTAWLEKAQTIALPENENS